MRKATPLLIPLLAFLAFPILRAQAQTLTTLYSFIGANGGVYPYDTDGTSPAAGLVVVALRKDSL
jgi:hypothetical protein